MNLNLDSKILQQIKKQNIQPKSRFVFLAKNTLLWLLIFIFFVMSSMALSVLFAGIFVEEFWFASLLAGSVINYFLLTAGVVWAGFTVLFASLIFVFYRKTKYGYRKPAYLIVILLLLMQFIFAYIFYSLNLYKEAEYASKKIMPIIKSAEARERMWHKPDKGLIVAILLDDDIFEEYYKYESGKYDIVGENELHEYREHKTVDDKKLHNKDGLRNKNELFNIINRLGKAFPKYLNFIDLDGNLIKASTTFITLKDKIILLLAERVVLAGYWEENIFNICAVKPSPLSSLESRQEIQSVLGKLGLTHMNNNGVFKDLLKQIETNIKFKRIYKCKQ